MPSLPLKSTGENSLEDKALPLFVSNHLKLKYGAAVKVERLKSAQHEMYAVTFSDRKIVVRLYKGGSKWSHLNRPTDIISDELRGYRIAQNFLANIPSVLYESLQPQPWAILDFIVPTENLNNYWTQSMVKTRLEFGYEEPHPRWGRVPTEYALEYAMLVLHQVIIPLHKGMRMHKPYQNMKEGLSYKKMLQKCQKSCDEMKDTADSRHMAAINSLQKAIQEVEVVQKRNGLDQDASHPHVLLHLDCQPQNLFFTGGLENSERRPSRIYSVLDWEESTIGDGRFELLLLGRNVCASREQASFIWKTYEAEFPGLGPLDPWLRLGSLHTITSLLLQLTNVTAGRATQGQPAVSGKLEREWQRWNKLY